MTSRLFSGLLLVVSMAAVAVALWTIIGNDLTPRRDGLLPPIRVQPKHVEPDRKRLSELRQIWSHLACFKRVETRPETLPATLNFESLKTHCGTLKGTPDLLEDETGAPYRYIRLNDQSFEICADFTDKSALRPTTGFDPETGCFKGTIFRPL